MGEIGILPCALMVVNAALGAGMLNFPYAFSLIDNIWITVALQLVTITLAFAGMVALAQGIDQANHRDDEEPLIIADDESQPPDLSRTSEMADESPVTGQVTTSNDSALAIAPITTYEAVMKETCGHFTSKLVELCIVLYTFGTCTTFTVVIGDLLESAMPCHYKVVGRIGGTILVMPILLLLFFPKDIGFLKNASILGVLSVFVVCFVVVFRCFVDWVPGPGPQNLAAESEINCDQPTTWYVLKKSDQMMISEETSYIQRLLSAFPTMAFAYQCHISAVPIYATSLSRRSLSRWSWTIAISFLLIFLVNSTTGLCGYLKFKGDTQPDILSNFDDRDPFVIVARVFMGCGIVASYPVLAFCGRSSFLSVIGREGSEGFYNGTTILWSVSTTILAIFVPNIQSVIGAIGNLAVGFMLVFPGLLLYRLQKFGDEDSTSSNSRRKLLMKLLSLTMVISGVVIFAVCLTVYVIQMTKV